VTSCLINKVAITPDVFEHSLYEDASGFRLAISNLFKGLQATGLVANMSSGQWLQFVDSHLGSNRPEVTKLLKVLIERERLVDTPSTSGCNVTKYEDWVEEAVALLRQRDVQGVISTLSDNVSIGAVHPATLDGIGEQPGWWIDDPTEKLQTTVRCDIKEYVKVLRPVLLHSSKIVFYDKFLDPSESRYRHFSKLLAVCSNSAKREYLRIELHRTVPHLSDPDSMLSEEGWRMKFAPLSQLVKTYGLRIHVCVWSPKSLQQGKHPRFVLSKIGSFSFDKGFGEDGRENNIVLFMGRTETQRWERNFDQNVNQPRFAFKISA
jgi:hypothetical protein